jgi:hypothetical protein
MKLIKDNIYEHAGKKYQSHISSSGNACVSCVFHDGNGGCDSNSVECYCLVGRFSYFALYKEENKMTEQEIVNYWVNNRKEMRAFAAAPKECQEWLWVNNYMSLVLKSHGKFVSDTIFSHSIPTVDQNMAEDYLKQKKESKNGKFIEYDIDEDGKYELVNGARPWWEDMSIHQQLHHQHDYLFAGWLFEDNNKDFPEKRWAIVQMGLDCNGGMTVDSNVWVKPLVPIKIRFWVKG